jgi:hypothetical protein
MTTFTAFKKYLQNMQMTFSYKAVMIQALLDSIDQQGKVTRTTLIEAFRAFYLNRHRHGLMIEKYRERNPSPMLRPHEVSDAQIWQILARYPLPLMGEFLVVTEDSIQIKPQVVTLDSVGRIKAKTW